MLPFTKLKLSERIHTQREKISINMFKSISRNDIYKNTFN